MYKSSASRCGRHKNDTVKLTYLRFHQAANDDPGLSNEHNDIEIKPQQIWDFELTEISRIASSVFRILQRGQTEESGGRKNLSKFVTSILHVKLGLQEQLTVQEVSIAAFHPKYTSAHCIGARFWPRKYGKFTPFVVSGEV